MDNDFMELGYVVIPDVLCAKRLDSVKYAISTAPSFEEGLRTRHINLLAVRELQSLPLTPLIHGYAQHCLGPDCVLSGFSTHELPPGAGGMAPHVDWPYLSMPVLPPPFPMLELQSIWMLDDFTEDNGATRVVPGSHLKSDKPNFERDSIPVTGKAGSVILTHGALWHCTGKNNSDKKRAGMLIAYVPKWVRPLEHLTRGIPLEHQAHMEPALRTLASLNVIDDFRKDYARYK
jgi:ectoine hydroxylase-related dioxygenase (phytanoyl-CoA dioxygenase family)